MDGEEFLECLRALPSLVYCHIQDVEFTDGWVFDALVYLEGGSNNLVPKLGMFIFLNVSSFSSHTNSIDESFMDMIESRWWPDPSPVHPPARHTHAISRLSSAELCSTNRETQVDVDILRRITRLQQQGFNFFTLCRV
jgi:hypothetical protein